MQRLLRTILITLFALATLALILPIFINPNYSVSRSIVIYKASPEVFKYVSHIKNQEAYSVWSKKDPNKKINIPAQTVLWVLPQRGAAIINL